MITNVLNYRPCFLSYYADGGTKKEREAIFHGFSSIYTDSGVTTIAVVELEDGCVHEVCTSRIRFADTEERFDDFFKYFTKTRRKSDENRDENRIYH